MKKFIFGVTDLGQNLLYNLTLEGIKIEGFFVEQKYKICDSFEEYPVYCWEELSENYRPEECGIYICIGYTQMNFQRKRIFEEVKRVGYKVLSYVSPRACVMSEDIGEGCLIFEQSYLGPYTKMGRGNVLYPRCVIAHHTVVGDFNYFAISSSVAGKVVVGNECFFGNNCFTRDKIRIGSRVLIGAGAYAYKNMQDDQVIVPARSVIKADEKSIDYM